MDAAEPTLDQLLAATVSEELDIRVLNNGNIKGLQRFIAAGEEHFHVATTPLAQVEVVESLYELARVRYADSKEAAADGLRVTHSRITVLIDDDRSEWPALPGSVSGIELFLNRVKGGGQRDRLDAPRLDRVQKMLNMLARLGRTCNVQLAVLPSVATTRWSTQSIRMCVYPGSYHLYFGSDSNIDWHSWQLLCR
ncbi:hypothetical protein [Mycobacteroides abscessus]|uniref:hypothetical protein n=1 Tax=Mycobacteroides abscessus TaxID=36809 RepID=UPI0009C6D045|nr:hypothetical protein [Mycobacteroides abscessus]SLH38055.1 Uncharacterised protein [Mycobacteroides abscessus subsp. massiliense]